MKPWVAITAILLLFLLVLSARLFVSFTNGNPSYDSHFAILQMEEIQETGTPRYEEPLTPWRYAFSPTYYYALAALGLVLPTAFAAKLLPNLLMALLVPVAALLAYRLGTRWTAVWAAFFAGFTPILFSSYLNTAAPITALMPIALLALLLFIDIEQRPIAALTLFALAVLISPMSWLLLLGLVIYLLLLLAERMAHDRRLFEMALVGFLLLFWYTLIVYKPALTMHGLAVLGQNLPPEVRAASFQEFTFTGMVIALGILPTAFAAIAIYSNLLEQRSRKVLLVMAFGLGALLVTAFRIVPLRTGLLWLSIIFAVLASPALHQVSLWIRRTRLERFHTAFFALLAIFFVLSSLLPAVSAGIQPRNGPQAEELAALEWFRTTPENTTVLLSPKTGYTFNVHAGRHYLLDEEYLLVENAAALLDDIDLLYTTPSVVTATELAQRYDVDYIYVGPLENERYPSLGAVTEHECFPLEHRTGTALIYSVNCTVGGLA